jgi:quinoprotein glucose dehydrogenase
MSYSKIFGAAAVLCMAQYLSPGAMAQETAGGTLTVWDGVYTKAQAERGKVTAETFCAQCHKADLTGDTAPDLNGKGFRTRWDAATLNELYTKIVKTMPKGGVHLPPENAPDVIAFILAQNGFPAGDRTLTTDADSLGRVRILGQNGPMAAEVGQLVRILGCLTAGPANTWQLTSAATPERSRSDEPSGKGEIAGLAAKPLGSSSIRLTGVDPDDGDHKGQRVEVKGILGADAIIVTSLQAVAKTCP